jgi:crotonobetaine/carnitine-CoA ligase
LRRLGVEQGDTVLSWLPNGPDALRVWFGLNYLGAVYVPINVAYRGGILEHVVDNADARLIVAHAQLLPRLEPIRRARLTDAVVVDGTVGAIDGLTLHDETALAPADADLPLLAREIAPWDTQSIIYTSGTTGPSKGVMSSYLQLYSFRFLLPRMAHFMVPRYVRVVEALPRTPTAKIEKVKLRAEGLTTDTWDREAAGIVVKREKIGAKND